MRRPGGVAVHGEEGRRPDPLGVRPSDQVPRPLRGDHGNVQRLRRTDLVEVDVEAVREQQQVAGPQSRLDVPAVRVGLGRVRHEHHHDVGLGRGLRRGQHSHPGFLRGGPRLRALTQPHAYVVARVLQVQGVGMSL